MLNFYFMSAYLSFNLKMSENSHSRGICRLFLGNRLLLYLHSCSLLKIVTLSLYLLVFTSADCVPVLSGILKVFTPHHHSHMLLCYSLIPKH